jgi:hypothetical protein
MHQWFIDHPELAQLLRDILIAILSAILGALSGRRAATRAITAHKVPGSWRLWR